MRAKTVRRFGLTLMLAVGLLAASFLLLYVPHVKAGPQGVTRTYPGAAPCNTSLQACIDGSADGDVINIAANAYIASVTLNKAVSLIGAGAAVRFALARNPAIPADVAVRLVRRHDRS